MKSKYLRDINCEYSYDSDERQKEFEKERELYGIASYETWNLDISFIEFIYISFMMYNEKNCIDTHYHTISFDNEKYDMQQLIDYIINISKDYLIKRKNDFAACCQIPHKFYKILENVMPLMWW